MYIFIADLHAITFYQIKRVKAKYKGFSSLIHCLWFRPEKVNYLLNQMFLNMQI